MAKPTLATGKTGVSGIDRNNNNGPFEAQECGIIYYSTACTHHSRQFHHPLKLQECVGKVGVQQSPFTTKYV
jgi:hypothetical protein